MRGVFLLLLVCGFLLVWGQSPSVLDTTVSIDCRQEPLEKVLMQLQERYNLSFSYSDDVIPVQNRFLAEQVGRTGPDRLWRSC
jgi:hypothetical protein